MPPCSSLQSASSMPVPPATSPPPTEQQQHTHRHVIGPYYDRELKRFAFDCPVCDGHGGAVAECTAEWLIGRRLVDREASCDCFERDPFPAATFPRKQMRNRRFFHYSTIAKLLGATGQGHRAALPRCVLAKIEKLYGDSEVGFRSRAA